MRTAVEQMGLWVSILVLSLAAQACVRPAPVSAAREPRASCPREIEHDAPLCALVSELDKARRLQECAWTLDEAGYPRAAASYLAYIERELLDGDILNMRRMGGGMGNGTGENYAVTFKSGVKAIYKPRVRDPAPAAEVAVYRIDRLLEMRLVPVTILRTIDGKVGSMQYFMPGTGNGWEDFFRWRTKQMQFLDVLIGNPDRHRGNWLFTYPADLGEADYDSGRQAAVDNDRAFSYEEALEKEVTLPTGRNRLFRKFEREFHRNLLRVTERALTEQLADLLDEEQLAQLLLTRKRILVELCERRDQAPGCLPM